MWVFAILIVLALGGVALVAAGRGEPVAEVWDDRPDVVVPPDRPLGAEDLRRIRFPLALRGYRMAEVDRLLDRLAEELEARAAAAPVEPPVEPRAEPQGEQRPEEPPRGTEEPI